MNRLKKSEHHYDVYFHEAGLKPVRVLATSEKDAIAEALSVTIKNKGIILGPSSIMSVARHPQVGGCWK